MTASVSKLKDGSLVLRVCSPGASLGLDWVAVKE